MAETAQSLWMERFGERVVSAEGRCNQVLGLIAVAQGYLQAELLVGNAAEGRARIQIAEEKLSRAAADLDFAYSVVTASWIILGVTVKPSEEKLGNKSGDLDLSVVKAATGSAPRGGSSIIPTKPLPSTDRQHDRNLTRSNAVTKLGNAAKLAKEALDAVEFCRKDLREIGFLLDNPSLPGVDGLIDADRKYVTKVLETVAEKARDSAMMTVGARADVTAGDNRDSSESPGSSSIGTP